MEPTQESKDRVEAFMKAYGELTKSSGCDFIAYPVFIPDGDGGFKVVVNQQPIDTTNRPTRSSEEFVPKP